VVYSGKRIYDLADALVRFVCGAIPPYEFHLPLLKYNVVQKEWSKNEAEGIQLGKILYIFCSL
jgi:hypothetical protein